MAHSLRLWFTRIRSRNLLQSSYWSLYTVLGDVQSRLLLALGLLSAIAAGIPLPLIAVVFRGIIDSFPPKEDDLDRAIYRIVGISFAYFFITFTWCVAWGELGRRISERLQIQVVDKVLGSDQTFFDVDPFDVTGVLVSDMQTIQRGTSEKVGLFIQSCSYFVATFVTGFVIDARITGVLFAAIVPVIIIITWTGSSLVSRYANRASDLTDHAASVAEGAIRCNIVVQAFCVADKLSDNHARLLRAASYYAIRKSIVGAIMLALVYWACYSLNALAFYWGSRSGGSSGTIYAVVFLILDASFVFNQVGPFIQTIAIAAGASSKVFALLRRDDSNIAIYSSGGVRLDRHEIICDIHFQEVDFCYPARPTKKVLDRLNFDIPGGRSTAIVGLSGSGKSTVVSLLLQLYAPSQGQIKIGEHDIRQLHLATYRSHTAVVHQNPVIFSGTVLDNIRCGITNSNQMEEEEIYTHCVRAAEEAHCDFIPSLPQGMHTVVSASQGLSGGQRQRICLARALARRPALLILDEPTSALDSWSEQRIEESLESVTQQTDMTIVTIAHRLATVRKYSNIVVMGEGQVLEQGSHSELLEKNNHYAALVDAQKLEQTLEQGDRSATSFATESSDFDDGCDPVESNLEKVTHHPMSGEKSVKVSRTTKFSKTDLLRGVFKYVRPHSALLSIGIAAAIVQGAIIIGEAIIFGHLIGILNTVQDRGQRYGQIDFYCLMFFVISLVSLSAAALNGICFGFVSEAFVSRMRDALLRTILIQDQTWFQDPDHTPAKLIADINQNSNNIAALSGPILQTLFATFSMIVSGMVVAFVSTPIVTVVAVSYVPAIMLSGYVRVKMLNVFNQRYSSINKEAAALASEAVQTISTVAAFGLEQEILHKYSMTLKVSYWRNFVTMGIGNCALSFSYSIIYFMYPLLYWWGSQQVRNGHYSQQDFFITLPAVVVASQQCGQFFTMAPELTSARHAARQIFKLLDSRPEVACNESTSMRHAALEIEEQKVESSIPMSSVFRKRPCLSDGPTGSARSSTSETRIEHLEGAEVVFQNVSFAYPSRPDSKVLQNVNLSIHSGQFVAFVGPSGAGKTSMVALLERFFDPIIGTVLVDGSDIRKLPLEAHRSRIGLVPQEPELFAGSISFNVSLGAHPGETISQTQIAEVCKACGIHDFISSLPEGYGTECGSAGSKLSGGQKQRIAVARALVRNPRVLLLDEATASLDSQSERDIQQAVAAARSNRTTIVIAHRLSTIQNADRIFVFDKGTLVDQGTHTELAKRNAIYSTMVQAQSL